MLKRIHLTRGGLIGTVSALAAVLLATLLLAGSGPSRVPAATPHVPYVPPPLETTAPSTEAPASSTSKRAEPDVDASKALKQLSTLEVKGRAPKTGYNRAEFGQRWSDDVNVDGGGNGCDTRNDILKRDLDEVEFRPKTRDCVVQRGVLHDAYTDETTLFVRGDRTSDQVQIDHVVSMSDAWQKGAQDLTPEERLHFANDPQNLQAVAKDTNQKKGDSDAASWLPPIRAYRCTFVSRQIAVKAEYNLWVTKAEKDAMTRVLEICRD